MTVSEKGLTLTRSLVKRREGQPLIALVLIVGLWAGLRSILWHSPFSVPDFGNPPVTDAPAIPLFAEQNEAENHADPAVLKRRSEISRRQLLPKSSKDMIATLFPLFGDDERSARMKSAGLPLEAIINELSGSSKAQPIQLRPAAEPNRTSLPQEYTTTFSVNSGAPGYVRNWAKKWSFDSWAFFRPRGASLGSRAGSLPATYGASQIGGVLRYRLSSFEQFDAKAYWRVNKAFADEGGGDIALGLSARPIEVLPVSIQGEMRLSRFSSRTQFRPAALLVTEFPPAQLPLQLQAEAYLQAGYVGGDFSTPFADGQARVDGEIAKFDLGKIRAGAGIWGGAQKGAARLDVGPSVSAVIPIATGTARLSVDYRQRIAGAANPPSGIAITVSTSF